MDLELRRPLATAYRTIASGVLAEPDFIRQIVRGSGDVIPGDDHAPVPLAIGDGALALAWTRITKRPASSAAA